MAQFSRSRPFGIFALFCIVGLLALNPYARDLDHPRDADLSVASERLPPERNALTLLLEAVRSLRYPDDYVEAADTIDLAIIGAAWDPAWVASILTRNATALTHFERAQQTDAFQVRVQSIRGEQRALGNWLMLAKLRALEARVQGLRGDGEGALHSTLALAHFGARIRELDGGRMVHYLTGTSVIRIALEALRRILKDAAVDPSQADGVVRSLEALRLGRQGWSQIARGDYQWIKGVLDESVAARDGEGVPGSRDPFARAVLDSLFSLTPKGYSLQRNRTLQRLADHYRASMTQVRATCLELRRHERGFGVLPRAPSVYSIERNALGDYWADLARTSIRVYQQTGCVTESHLSAVQVMVALRAFEVKRGQMPELLSELVPDYFDQIPLDYFDGNPIRYSSTQHLIYSVGSDFIDAQGQWHPGEPCNVELRFPIPFATPNHRTALPARTICKVSRS